MKTNETPEVKMCDSLAYLVNECGYTENEAREMLCDDNDYSERLYIAI